MAADLTKMPLSEKGNCYILVVQDYFTKYVDLYALPDKEALPVAQKLYIDYISKHGPPLTLHSDQGKQFENKVAKALNETFGIRKTRTSPYHPKSDGQVERFNRTVKDMVAKHMSNSGKKLGRSTTYSNWRLLIIHQSIPALDLHLARGKASN